MSRRLPNIIVIEPEIEDSCQLCGRIAETRPYGPGGKRICYDCGLKYPEIVKHNMELIMFGKSGELK